LKPDAFELWANWIEPVQPHRDGTLRVAALRFLAYRFPHAQHDLVGFVQALEVRLRGVALVRRVLVRVRSKRRFAIGYVDGPVPPLLIHRQLVVAVQVECESKL
jgi:hypothetical protein